MNGTSLKQKTGMAKKHEKVFNCRAIWDVQNKAKIRYLLSPSPIGLAYKVSRHTIKNYSKKHLVFDTQVSGK